ncbi:hypothetical protein ACFL27_10910 [candidate division CSSED10-310 bacterium]|uniref:Uncharacterized protein n=1 Tax=candidate division CSSED10-310 bacterium TaxID=2855610 RepID=A0ABV6YWW1_UNCC1
MDKKTLSALAIIIAVLMGLVLVAAVLGGGLSKTVQKSYESTKADFSKAKQNLEKLKQTYESKRKKYPDYLAQIDKQENITGFFDKAEESLAKAQQSFDSEITPLYKKDKKKDNVKISADLKTVKSLVTEVTTNVDWASKRLDSVISYRENYQKYVKNAQVDYDHIKNRTFYALSEKVKQAQTDWPEKKSDLDNRLKNFQQLFSDADQAYQYVQAENDKGDNIDYVLLGNNADRLAQIKTQMDKSSDELSKLVDQLYVSYDKKLTDMEIREGMDVEFYHTYKVMKVDKDDQATNTDASEKVTETVYKANENNLGMVIESKPKGKYNFEATKKPTPPGYNYVGNSHYGRWERDQYGHRHWRYHSHYSYYPLFFYGSGYRSRYIYYDDWHSYRTYNSYGRTYYGMGRDGSSLYGTKGSYTKTSYANSKYYKSSGYSSSKYKSSGGSYKGSRYSSSSSSSTSKSSSSYRGSSYSRSKSSGGK